MRPHNRGYKIIDIENGLLRLVHTESPKVVEAINGIHLLLWGLWLLINSQLLASPLISMPFLKMVPNFALGIMGVLLGGVQLAFLFIENHRIRPIASLVTFIFWFLITISLLASAPWNPQTPTYLVITVYNLWLNYRVRKNIDNIRHHESR